MQRWSNPLAWLLCVATLVLLAAGALVTSTGSSLAVPDWPLAYGQLFPPMVGGILYEHGHRMIAALVGLLTAVLTAWLWWAEPRRWVVWLAMGALWVVIVQGVLGGITVLLLLPKSVSVSHALLAQTFFVLTVVLVQVTAQGWPALLQRLSESARQRSTGQGRAGVAPWMAVTLLALASELLLGAIVRHNNAGLAIPDFPLAYGRLIPPLTSFLIVIHYLHRLGAVVVLLLVAWSVWRTVLGYRDEPALFRPAVLLAVLVIVQIGLGGGVIWSLRSVAFTTLHVVNGALLMGTTALLTLRAALAEGWAAGVVNTKRRESSARHPVAS